MRDFLECGLVSKSYLTIPVIASLAGLFIICLLVCALFSGKHNNA